MLHHHTWHTERYFTRLLCDRLMHAVPLWQQWLTFIIIIIIITASADCGVVSVVRCWQTVCGFSDRERLHERLTGWVMETRRLDLVEKRMHSIDTDCLSVDSPACSTPLQMLLTTTPPARLGWVARGLGTWAGSAASRSVCLSVCRRWRIQEWCRVRVIVFRSKIFDLWCILGHWVLFPVQLAGSWFGYNLICYCCWVWLVYTLAGRHVLRL